ncbi:MAG: mismatch repair protein [Acidobacteriaceae bacterium]|nr:mismatch repair protein [Acidobacteriaceae bacterium]
MNAQQEYASRLKRWQAAEERLQKQFVTLGNWRLVIAILSGVLAWAAFGRGMFSGYLVLLPVSAFAALLVWHFRVIRRRDLARRAIAFYERGLAAIEDRWMEIGDTGEHFRDNRHVYAEDLDLFGKGSLFQMLARARSHSGEQTLANWLLAPAGLDEATARQNAVKELADRLDLREDVALLGEDVRSNVEPDRVARWGSAPSVEFPLWLRAVAPVLAIAGTITLVLALAAVIPASPFLAVLACDVAIIYFTRKEVNRITSLVEEPAQGLNIFSLLLARLEEEDFTAPRLRQIRSALVTEGLPASRRVRHLERWMEWLDSADHMLVRVVAPVLLWRQQCAFAVEIWRRKNGTQVARWLEASGEFEALSSFAALAFERPDWAFPALCPDESGVFEARELRHPLIPRTKCVPNDAELGATLRVLIVSGSNMSGKSTLLRATGLNAVLAWAGAPVAAVELRISPLQVGASIRITDSLQDNRSRFFAEILRLREIVDLTKSGTRVLFLLDELLSGTNSRDRRIGAAAIVRALVDTGAMGMITTHDLALAEIERDLGQAARNSHFEDRITNGQVEFDYRLRPGVVAHSNALELMRTVGLIV